MKLYFHYDSILTIEQIISCYIISSMFYGTYLIFAEPIYIYIFELFSSRVVAATCN